MNQREAISVCSLPPCGAGLSHVAEEFEEESIVPSCALELGSQGDFCVGMSAGDIEGEAPQDGEVGWALFFWMRGQSSSSTASSRQWRPILVGPWARPARMTSFGRLVLPIR